MTPAEVASEIERVFDRDPEKELAELADRLGRADGGDAFRALFPFASRSQSLGPAAGAAWLLRRVNPTCPVTCLDATRELLTDWDISIEEVPFYLAQQFGSPAVREAISLLRQSVSDKDHSQTLSTIEYWLGCFDEMQAWEAQEKIVEPCAAPNVDPAASVDNSCDPGGPPSVS